MLTIKKITAEKSNELLQKGGINFILFPGEEFDAQVFAEWHDYSASEAECKAVDAALADLDDNQALKIDVKD